MSLNGVAEANEEELLADIEISEEGSYLGFLICVEDLGG